MISWLSVFANNIADYLFFPVIGGTIVAAAVALWSIRDRQQKNYQYGSVEFVESRWRTLASMQGAVIMWLVWGVLNSVPEPDYLTKEVRVVRTVTINKNIVGTYAQAYDHCYRRTGGIDSICHKRALLITNPNIKFIVKSVPAKPQVVIKYRIKTDPYRTLFNSCMGLDVQKEGWSLTTDEELQAKGDARTTSDLRDDRIELCHRNAIEAREELIG